MKKNFLIMMIMLLCSGFAFAQINTVRGFVPGAGTGAGNNDQTYAVFGQMFGNIDLNAANPYEVAEGLAQAQLIADTVEAVVGCGDSLIIDEFTLSVAAIQTIVNEFAADPTRPRDTFLTIQHPNAAIYNYDKLLVLHLFVCPCTIDDYNGNPYDVVAIDNICWTKTNMRATTTCGGIDVVTKSYSTDVTPELDPATFGLLYTWENASKASKCDSNYVTGICPCGWHLPTAAEVDTILKSYTNDLRSNGGYWVVPEGITNLTKFTAEPAGYFDSLATRFEGFHSEADFWYVATDSTCNADYFQIYYFCDKPKHEPRNVNTDAMSVRCVLDMIYDYHKDDPTPNPQPQPTPTKTCNVSSVTVTPDQNDPKSIMITITPVTAPLTAEDLVSVKVTVTSYTVLNGAEAVEVTSNPETVSLDNLTADGTLTWTYNPTVGDQLQAITGIVNVDGVTSGSDICGAEVEFNTAPTPTPNCPTLTITPTGFDRIEGTISPYSANDNYSIEISGHYVGVFQENDKDEDFDEEVSSINPDGTFIWEFDGGQYDVDYVTSITGEFTITGLPQGCPQSFEFNTAPSCSLSVGQVNLNVNSDGVVATVLINNLSSDYLFDDNSISCGFMFYNENEEGNMYNPAYSSYDYDLFDTVTSNGVTTLTAALPAGVTIPSKDFVQFWVVFNINPEYYYCSEDPDIIIHREATQQINSTPDQPIGNNCPTSYQLDALNNNSAKLTIQGYDADVVQSANITFHVYQSGSTSAQDYAYNDITIDEGSNATFTATLSGVSMEGVTKITASASVNFNPSNYNFGLCETPNIETVTVYEATNNNCPSYGEATLDNGSQKIVYIPINNYNPNVQYNFTASYTFYSSVSDQQGVTYSATCEVSNSSNGYVLTLTPSQVPDYLCGLRVHIQSNGCQQESQTLLICE